MVRDALTVQAARNAAVAARGKKAWYEPRWDLSDLPHYRPEHQVSGKLCIWGNNYIRDGRLEEYWTEGFRKYHPQIEFDNYLPTTAIGLSALTCGAADIGMSRRCTFLELLAFQRLHKVDPLEIPAVTGALDVPGWTPGFAIFVNKANPIKGLSMKQLDGIFGGPRLGGWVGTEWHPEFARGKEQNIRTWGQAGLTGEWADKTINVYAVSMRYNSTYLFADIVLKSSDQYNEDMRCYANYQKPDGTLVAWFDQMREALDNDPYGINYSFLNAITPKTKALPIQVADGGPYIEMTYDTVREHLYPLYTEQYFYINRQPGKPLDPKVKEFVRYVLSQEGQNEVQRDGKYLPLTAKTVRENLKKLD